MNDEIINTILKETYSVAELTHKISILKSYVLDSLFTSQSKIIFLEKDLAWLKSLPPAFWQNFTKDNVYDLFSELEKQKNNLKVLTIYLSFDPDENALSQINAMARKEFTSFSLLDVKFDPNLIAGAALVWKGIYKDYSLRAQIAGKQTEILASFKKYLR